MASEAIENKGPQLHALAIAFVSLAWIGVLLRAYTRAFIVKQITWDDKFIGASLVRSTPVTSITRSSYCTDQFKVFYTLYCSFVLVGVHYGTGRHDADLSVDSMLTALRV